MGGGGGEDEQAEAEGVRSRGVDADQHKDLAGKYDVSGYPTIKIFKNGKIDSDYDGPREAKGIVKFVKSAVGITGGAASVQRISTKAELDEMAKATATLVGLFKEPVSASAMFKAFAEVALASCRRWSTRRIR